MAHNEENYDIEEEEDGEEGEDGDEQYVAGAQVLLLLLLTLLVPSGIRPECDDINLPEFANSILF